MTQIWNCLEVLHSTHCIHQLLPHWSLYQWNSALLTVLLLSPTATITSTNIHLFCDVFLMEHINWLCCCLHRYSIISYSSRIFSFFLFFFFLPVMLYYSYTLMFSLFTALLLCCCVSFCSLLDGVCLSGNKRITYLLTYFTERILHDGAKQSSESEWRLQLHIVVVEVFSITSDYYLHSSSSSSSNSNNTLTACSSQSQTVQSHFYRAAWNADAV